MKTAIAFFLAVVSMTLEAQYVDLTWDLIGHYPMIGNAEDISVYDNHGVVAGAMLSPDRFEKPENAYYFDGLDDHIDCGRNLEPVTSGLTVSCWVRSEDEGKYSHVVSKYDFTSDGGFILGTEDGRVIWAGRIGAGRFIRLFSSIKVNDGQWHHLLGMVDGGRWSLFVDGSLANQLETGNTGTDLHCNAPLTIGKYHDGDNGDHRYFQGHIDELLIFRRALNACEIEVLYNGNIFVER